MSLFALFAKAYRGGGFGFGLGLHNRLQAWLRGRLLPEKVELGDFHLYLDREDAVVSYHLAADKVWEPVQTAAWRRVLKPGMTVFDVGAHIGYYSLMAAALVGPKGRVYAFEPEPRNLALLKRNVESNKASVTIVPKAVSLKTGTSALSRDPSNKGAHFLSDQGLPVETVDLDTWAKDLAPQAIKLDIEGSEWEAVRGMQGLLRAHKPALFLELLPLRLGKAAAELLAFLAALGYRFTLLDESAHGERPIDAEEILGLYAQGRMLALLAEYSAS